jgi:hypothetical protein
MSDTHYPIVEAYIHPELIIKDLVTIAQIMTEKEVDEFLDQYVDLKERAMKNPFPHPNVELKYDLAGWNRLDYFSMKKPPHKYGPDYRLVFRFDRDFGFFTHSPPVCEMQKV